MLSLIEKAKTICIDADDTTNNYFSVFLDWHNSIYRTSFKIDDFWTRKFHLVLGCSGEEAIRRVDEFQHSPYFERILPLEGAVNGINLLYNMDKKLYIVTARDDSLMKSTEEFYDRYFNGKFLEIIHSSNHHTGKSNSGRTKAEICAALGGAILIDDDLSYVLQLDNSILFGNYRWQRSHDRESIPRLKNWRLLNAN